VFIGQLQQGDRIILLFLLFFLLLFCSLFLLLLFFFLPFLLFLRLLEIAFISFLLFLFLCIQLIALPFFFPLLHLPFQHLLLLLLLVLLLLNSVHPLLQPLRRCHEDTANQKATSFLPWRSPFVGTGNG